MSAVLVFLKKNWLIIVILIGGLIMFGAFKGWIAKIKTWINVSSSTEGLSESQKNIDNLDYDLMCVNINEAFHGKDFLGIKLSENEGQAISIVNSCPTSAHFTKLVYKYALKYNNDLRAELRRYCSDKQYAQLKFI